MRQVADVAAARSSLGASVSAVLAHHAALFNQQFVLDTSAIQRAAEGALKSLMPPDLSAVFRDLVKTQDIQAALQQRFDAFTPLHLSVHEYLDRTGFTARNLAGELAATVQIMAAQNRLALDATMASALQSALEYHYTSQPPSDGSSDDLLAATLAASHDAVESAGASFDWKTWFQIVLTLLLFLIDRQDSQQSEARLLSASDSLRSEVARQDSQLSGVLRGIGKAATVVHPTFLRDRPWAGSTSRQRLAEGTPVTILQRRGKWSFVMLSAEQASSTSTGFGWTLNKYLRPE